MRCILKYRLLKLKWKAYKDTTYFLSFNNLTKIFGTDLCGYAGLSFLIFYICICKWEEKLARVYFTVLNLVARVGIEYKNLWQTLVDMIFPCLNFPSSFLMGKSNQNKQCQQISSFCLISFFFNFQRTHDRIDIYRLPNRKWYFLRFQTIWFET